MDEVFSIDNPPIDFTISSLYKLSKRMMQRILVKLKDGPMYERFHFCNVYVFFLWLSIEDRLMTNRNSFICKLTSDRRCMMSGEVKENLAHTLRISLVARLLW